MTKYTEESAVRKLVKNKVKVEGKTIYVENAGLGELGTIDFLVHYLGYSVKKPKSLGKKG